MNPTTEKEHQCPLCGCRFTRAGARACKGCPMGQGCDRIVCCPHCGYGFVERSAIVDWIRKLLRGRVKNETPSRNGA